MRRRLIVNADDFGRSCSINQAVIQAHDSGVLTCASLMVNGDAFDQAVAWARERPSLGVGLHLTLADGRSTLASDRVPGLVTHARRLRSSPVGAGIAYFFRPRLHPELDLEITAQLDKFRATGLELDHINGHLNMHLHPTVLRLLLNRRQTWGGAGFRLVRDPFWLNVRLAPGRWTYRISHALVFRALSRRARSALQQHAVRHSAAVFGLLQNGCVTEDFLLRLLPRLPAGSSEIYTHPCGERAPQELAALTSPRVHQRCAELGIERIRYADL